MNTRIYKINDKENGAVRLVEANSAAQALRHVAAERYEATTASPKDVAAAMANGTTVETANAATN